MVYRRSSRPASRQASPGRRARSERRRRSRSVRNRSFRRSPRRRSPRRSPPRPVRRRSASPRRRRSPKRVERSQSVRRRSPSAPKPRKASSSSKRSRSRKKIGAGRNFSSGPEPSVSQDLLRDLSTGPTGTAATAAPFGSVPPLSAQLSPGVISSMPATPGLLRSLGLEMCADFKRGNCHRGERCKFSHGDGTGREPFGIEMCADFKRGACFRDHCKFSHGESAPQIARVVPVVPRLGVEMCADFKRGACFRERCRFSHGEPLGEMSSLSSLSLNGSSNLPSALPSALPSPQSANLDVAEAAAKAAAALMAKETPKTREPHGPKIEVGSDVQFFHNGTWTIGTALAYSADGEKLTVLTDSEQLEVPLTTVRRPAVGTPLAPQMPLKVPVPPFGLPPLPPAAPLSAFSKAIASAPPSSLQSL